MQTYLRAGSEADDAIVPELDDEIVDVEAGEDELATGTLNSPVDPKPAIIQVSKK